MNILTEEEQRRVTCKNLKRLLEEKDLSAAEVGRRIGVSESTARSWFNGQRYPRIKQLQALAEFFGVSRADIEGTGEAVEHIQTAEIATIPVVHEHEENVIVEYMEVLAADVRGGEFFALIMEDNSMAPVITKGDRVVIKKVKVNKIMKDDIVAAKIHNKIELFRMKEVGNKKILSPDNNLYDPVQLGSQYVDVIGKAVSSIKKF